MKPKKKPKPKKRGAPRKGTPDWAPKFLAEIVSGLHVTDACNKVGVDNCMPYQRRVHDEVFKKAWSDAAAIGLEALENEAARRAFHGTLKPVFQGGVEVGAIREYSDTLMMFLLRSRDPKYRDKSKVELSGKDGGPIPLETTVIDGHAKLLGFADELRKAAEKNLIEEAEHDRDAGPATNSGGNGDGPAGDGDSENRL